MTLPYRRNKLEWCNFEWFQHRKEIFLESLTVRCRNSNGKSQKILFFFDEMKKHLTLDLSKKMLDIHMTSDIRGRPHQNIMSIPLRRINRKIRRNKQALSKYVQVIPFNNNYFKQFVLVDPYSNKFLKHLKDLSEFGNIPPTKLLKLRVRRNDAIRNNKKHFFVYDLCGRIQGFVEIDSRKYEFKFCSEVPIHNISNELYDREYLKNKLREEGLESNPRYEKMWRQLDYVIPIVQKILRIRSLINLDDLLG